MAKFYDCIAYRWGWLNNHWYTVYVGDDKDKAIALAQCETQDRAGKYGVEIREWDGEECKIIAHVPSTYGEKRAYTNAIIYAQQHFGATCHMAVQDGFIMVPDENRKGYLKKSELTLPPELIERWEKHLGIGKMMEQFGKEQEP